VGSRHELDANSVRRVCEALDLRWSDLPGPKSRCLISLTTALRSKPETHVVALGLTAP
jgi:hypothetical protein